jgi:hypothetical protein
LVNTNIIKDGKTYYCPSEINDQWVYNGTGGGLNDFISANPWPFDKTITQRETRFGYANRPCVGWVMPPPPPTGGGEQIFLTYNGKKTALPRLTQLKNKAILADANMSPLHLKARHIKGVNVLYGNGGAKWVPKDAFAKGTEYSKILEPPSDVNIYTQANAPKYNAALLNEVDKATGALINPPSGLWVDYDRN